MIGEVNRRFGRRGFRGREPEQETVFSGEAWKGSYPSLYSQNPDGTYSEIRKTDLFVQEPRIIKDLLERKKNTPDYHELRVQPEIPVFIYDNLKSDKPLRHNFDGLPYLGKARSSTARYVMKQTMPRGTGSLDLTVVPVVFDGATSPIKAAIKGEVFALPPEGVLWLDKYYRNNIRFKRELRHFFLTDQETPSFRKLHPSVKAWVYIGMNEHWEHMSMTVSAKIQVSQTPPFYIF